MSAHGPKIQGGATYCTWALFLTGRWSRGWGRGLNFSPPELFKGSIWLPFQLVMGPESLKYNFENRKYVGRWAPRRLVHPTLVGWLFPYRRDIKEQGPALISLTPEKWINRAKKPQKNYGTEQCNPYKLCHLTVASVPSENLSNTKPCNFGSWCPSYWRYSPAPPCVKTWFHAALASLAPTNVAVRRWCPPSPAVLILLP